jgi:hypothetical protein
MNLSVRLDWARVSAGRDAATTEAAINVRRFIAPLPVVNYGFRFWVRGRRMMMEPSPGAVKGVLGDVQPAYRPDAASYDRSARSSYERWSSLWLL